VRGLGLAGVGLAAGAVRAVPREGIQDGASNSERGVLLARWPWRASGEVDVVVELDGAERVVCSAVGVNVRTEVYNADAECVGDLQSQPVILHYAVWVEDTSIGRRGNEESLFSRVFHLAQYCLEIFTVCIRWVILRFASIAIMDAEVNSDDIPHHASKPVVDASHPILCICCLATTSETSTVLHLGELIARTSKQRFHIQAVATSSHRNRIAND